jgi:hypothetical protein
MEKNILRIATGNLKNNAHFELLRELLGVLTQTTIPLPAKLAVRVRELTALVADEESALVQVQKYETTDAIADLDTERDNLGRGMADIQRAARRDFDPIVQAAAARLQAVFNTVGNVVRMPYDEETAAIDSLLQELDNRAADVATVGLTRWANELRRVNGELHTLFTARYSEEAQRSHVKLHDVRRQVDIANLDTFRLLEAAAALDEADTYKTLFAEINARISRYKTLLAQAKGRRKAASPDDTKTTTPEA